MTLFGDFDFFFLNDAMLNLLVIAKNLAFLEDRNANYYKNFLKLVRQPLLLLFDRWETEVQRTIINSRSFFH